MRNNFDTLVKAVSPELYRYALGLCHNPHQAEDLVQETFLRAWRAQEKLRNPKAARAWLYTILRNENARLYERQRPEVRDPNELPPVPCKGYDTSAEAFALYQRHLSEDGVIAVHCSNRYLDLRPLLYRHAADLGLTAVFVANLARGYADAYSENCHASLAAEWTLLTRNQEFVRRLGEVALPLRQSDEVVPVLHQQRSVGPKLLARQLNELLLLSRWIHHTSRIA